MKNLLIFPLFLLIIIQSFGQSSDSLKNSVKSYKQNVQTNLLGFIGDVSLQYEYGFNKDFSLSLIGNYEQLLSLQTSSQKETAWVLASKAKYYLDKNDIINDGLYISALFRYVYRLQQSKTNDSEAHHKYPSIGLGIGYQRFIKKRIVVNIEGSLFYNLSAQSDYPYDNTGWIESKKYNYSVDRSALNLNIGYRF